MFKTNIAQETWRKKYQYNNETPIETQIRIAKALASVEKNPKEWEEIFLKTLVKFDINNNPSGLKCTPGGRITANIGTDFKGTSLLNCYGTGAVKNATITYERKVPNSNITIPVVYKSPDTGDNMTNIVLTLLEQALTLGSEGGWGINISFIRPRGSLVKTIGVEHPGVIKFLEVFDKMSDVIVAGNNDGYLSPLKNYMTEQQLKDLQNLWKVSKKKTSRKGACMAVLDINHPDIEEFVLAKQQGKQLTKFNMSVLVTDEFLKAVENNDFFELKFDDKIYKKIKARQLYDLIMSSTYNRNEPGILFYDNMQQNNPVSYLGDTKGVNPCGEIPINQETTTTCLLGSLNLTQYVLPNRTFNWDEYEEDIKVFARMLDNVVDLHNKDLPSYLWSTKNYRQFGMGLNGFGSMLYMLGIPYNSPDAIEMAEDLNKAKLNLCLQTSALLAKEKGKAPMFDEEKYFKTNYWTKFLKGKLTGETIELVKQYGVRNLKVTTSPPLGNTSVICDNISNGLEPVFLHNYERTIICNWPQGLTIDNVKTILKEIKVADVTCWRGEYNGITYYYEPHNRGLCTVEVVYDYGYKWVLENFPEDLKTRKEIYVTTNELKVEDHINIQVAFQKFLDQSVSKCMAADTTMVIIDNKIIYLDEIQSAEQEENTYSEFTGVTLNHKGKKVSIDFLYNNGIKDLLKIKFSDNSFIECTYTHRVFTSNGWFKAIDLNIFDKIPLFNVHSIFNKKK